jgi:hypothetical protein
MTLILKPRGRGNWGTVVLQVHGQRAAPLLVRVGDPIVLGGVTFKITEVLA